MVMIARARLAGAQVLAQASNLCRQSGPCLGNYRCCYSWPLPRGVQFGPILRTTASWSTPLPTVGTQLRDWQVLGRSVREVVAVAIRRPAPCQAKLSSTLAAVVGTTTLLAPRPPPIELYAAVAAAARGTAAGSSRASRVVEEVRPSTKGDSTPGPDTAPAITADHPIVGHWMLFCASMVFGIIVWGGLTRLTESGLSIVEWAPVYGAKLPGSEKEWETEFEKYKQFPEYKRIHAGLTLDEFKRIYFMEWFHRNIGRLIGLAYGLPAIYFVSKGYVTRRNIIKVAGLGALLLGQGAMGWYMVASGLREELGQQSHAVPRVSHYRLATHLALAYAFFAGLCLHGWSTRRLNRLARGRVKNAEQINGLLAAPSVRSFHRSVKWTAGLVLLTSLSGALVAGLDAGLIYNTFPHMGDSIIPPLGEFWSPYYARDLAGNPQSMWFNLVENPATVQLNHRILAISTFFIISSLWWRSRCLKLNPAVRLLTHAMMGAAALQVGLGICTLVDLVPISLASAHQANSVGLLTTVLALAHALRPLPRRVIRL